MNGLLNVFNNEPPLASESQESTLIYGMRTVRCLVIGQFFLVYMVLITNHINGGDDEDVSAGRKLIPVSALTIDTLKVPFLRLNLLHRTRDEFATRPLAPESQTE